MIVSSSDVLVSFVHFAEHDIASSANIEKYHLFIIKNILKNSHVFLVFSTVFGFSASQRRAIRM